MSPKFLIQFSNKLLIMKKILFMAAIAVLGLSNVNAQDEKTGGFANGDVYASGNVNYNSFKQGDVKSNDLTFSPTVGYFVSDNVALEAGLIIGSSENTSQDESSSFGGSLGATYFFTPANQFSFNIGAAVGYSNTKVEFNSGGESKINALVVAVAPGVNYFISNCFALRASIGALSYSSAKADFSGAEAANNFAINLSLSNVNFGLTYKF